MTTPAPATPPPKSKLVPIGILFGIVGLFGREPFSKAVAAMQPGTLRTILLVIATDGLAILFVAGLTCILIGCLRNKRARRLKKG